MITKGLFKFTSPIRRSFVPRTSFRTMIMMSISTDDFSNELAASCFLVPDTTNGSGQQYLDVLLICPQGAGDNHNDVIFTDPNGHIIWYQLDRQGRIHEINVQHEQHCLPGIWARMLYVSDLLWFYNSWTWVIGFHRDSTTPTIITTSWTSAWVKIMLIYLNSAPSAWFFQVGGR